MVVTTNKYLHNAIGTEHIEADAITNAKGDANQPKHLCFLYDFDALGGTAGALTLTDNAGAAQTIPDNAVITEVVIEGITDNTSGGSATIALGYTGVAAGFLAATAFDNAIWDVNAVTVGAPVAATGKTTAEVSVLATVATADLTAGKWQVWVTYYEGA